MRRLVPWVLLVLLALGTGVGAAAGQAGSPTRAPSPSAEGTSTAAQWVDQVLATTKAAGTAHFTYRDTSTSPAGGLNGTQSGRGVVDFSTRRVSVTETETNTSTPGRQQAHQVTAAGATFSVVSIGSSMYQNVGGPWIKSPALRDPYDRLGLGLAGGALGALEGPEPVVGVRRLGHATVDGVATTRYVVTTAQPRPCNAQQAAETKGSSMGPTTLWVDGSGRLVQASMATHTVLRPPSSLQRKFPSLLPEGPISSTSTLHLGQFGVPVTIVAPKDVLPPSSSHSISISLRTCS